MTGPLRILYVDDDDDIRTIATMSLRLDDDVDVRTASSGREALEMLADNPAWRPQVILLDVMMPGMDGFEVHRALETAPGLASVATIFMTARASRAGMDEYRAAGAAGVILKPFDPLGLAKEVRSIVGEVGGT